MARRVFFSFHFDEDIWRVSQVRNSWVTKDWEPNTPIDKASWETVKREGDDAVKRWINNQLDGTSVTVVLIGAYTSTRKFVNYEIKRSYELGKGLLGVRIHNLKNNPNEGGVTSWPGTNPLDNFSVEMPSAFSPIRSGLVPRASLSPFRSTSGLTSNPLNAERPSAFSSLRSGLTSNPLNAERPSAFSSLRSGLTSNPLNKTRKRLSEIFKTYDWVNDNGYLNFTTWVEEAAKIRGR